MRASAANNAMWSSSNQRPCGDAGALHGIGQRRGHTAEIGMLVGLAGEHGRQGIDEDPARTFTAVEDQQVGAGFAAHHRVKQC